MEDLEASNNILFANDTDWPIPIGENAKYKCKSNHFFESNKQTEIDIECEDGNVLDWPDPWPNCVTHIVCPDEPPTPGANMSNNYVPSHTYKNADKVT